MRCDALTLSAVRDELEPRVVGARIQRLAFPDATSVVVETYRPALGRSYVLLSIDAERARVQLVPGLPARGVERDSPFMLLARKHLRSGRIRAVRQPALERVLEWDIEQRDDEGRHYEVLLIVEVMGRRGNLILVGEDGAILDALRRTPPSRNAVRPILPHLRYTPPPPQDRQHPANVSAAALADGARGKGGSLAEYLTQTLAGTSPLVAREVAFRAAGSPDAPLHGIDWSTVVRAAREVFRPVDDGSWQPTLARDETGPVAYAPYPPKHLGAAGCSLHDAPSMSAAMQTFYVQLAGGQPRPRGGDPLAAERRALLERLGHARGAVERRVAALERQVADEGRPASLRLAGESILTNQWAIVEGQDALEADGAMIRLDPALTPVENAQHYFAQYRKAREARARVPGMIEVARLKLRHLADLEALVQIAEGAESMRALRREVAVAGGEPVAEDGGKRTKAKAGRARRTEPGGPFRRYPLAAGWEALVGTSAAGNAHVTLHLARPDDLWLHARGIPGAHVVLRGQGAGEPPPEAVQRAAQLAAWHSAARGSGLVEVDAAPRRHVRSIPEAPPGLVRYSHERTLRVRPALPTDG